MTTNRIIDINFDTILACLLTDLHDAHARNDLRDSINACDDLDHFAELALIDARDADDLPAILAADATFDADCDLITSITRDRYTDLHAAMLAFLRSLNY